jgi:hypothetical protein
MSLAMIAMFNGVSGSRIEQRGGIQSCRQKSDRHSVKYFIAPIPGFRQSTLVGRTRSAAWRAWN